MRAPERAAARPQTTQRDGPGRSKSMQQPGNEMCAGQAILRILQGFMGTRRTREGSVNSALSARAPRTIQPSSTKPAQHEQRARATARAPRGSDARCGFGL